MLNILNKIEKILLPSKNEKNNKVKIFFIGLIFSTIIFLPFIIYNKGALFLYGDFNKQQIPFYYVAHDAIKNGNFGISWLTDLGSNFIASYSFYLLGSPFFWLTIPFPTNFIPYLMAPLLCLKFSVASLTSYTFIRKFTKTPHAAFIGALLYSFSGFSIYNTFFNHFHEVIAFFPLLLIGFEEHINNKKRGFFAIAVAINLTINYYFFVPEMVFLFLYFIFRYFNKNFKYLIKNSKSTLITLFLEFLIGVMIGFILFLPSAILTIENPRVKNMLFGYDMLFYPNIQRYGLILHSLFFPPDMPGLPTFFSKANACWQSVSSYIPLFGMSGTIAFLKGSKKSWLKKFLITLFIFMSIPILNSIFNGLNSSYYARWFFCLTLILALITAIALEKYLKYFIYAIKINLIFIIPFCLIGIVPKKEGDKILFFNLPNYKAIFWVNFSIALIGIIITFFIIKNAKKTNDKINTLYKNFIMPLSGFIIIYSITQISYGTMFYFNNNNYKEIITQGINNNLNLSKDEFFRTDLLPETKINNLSMLLKVPCIQTFHSTVSSSIMKFYINMGLNRDVHSKIPSDKYYNLRDFLSVKYILIKENYEEFEKKLPKYYKFLKTKKDIKIYENENFINMGFIQDKYIEKEKFLKLDNETKEKTLLKALILSKDQIEKYKNILSPLKEDEIKATDEETMQTQIKKLKNSSCENFKENSYGFDAKINLKKAGMVVFSVPYEYSYTATINEQKTKIEEVDFGLMAVKCEKGENIIKFKYKTPGLKKSTFISVLGLFLYLAYIIYIHKIKKFRYESSS